MEDKHLTVAQKALLMHEKWKGKLETVAKSKVNTREDLAIAYTPGVAEPCKVIAENKEAAYTYTMKANTVAVISDGSAVLGLGNIGAYAAMPVMEGKCVLFKEFGNINAVPICLDTQDTEEIIATIRHIAPAYGGINLEDISAPRCFEIEERLKSKLNIPVFHDDQHGTAIVVLAGIINALRITGKQKESCRIVVNGAGSAGIAITKLLLTYGFSDVTMCGRSGIIGKTRKFELDAAENDCGDQSLQPDRNALRRPYRRRYFYRRFRSQRRHTGNGSVHEQSRSYFAMANPVPEIMPEAAKAAGAHRRYGTQRFSESDQQRCRFSGHL